MADSSTAVEVPRPTLRDWIRDHDESWIFVVVYLGLAVGLSVFVSLFWLVVVAALHLGLELIRQNFYRDGAREVVLHALWEIKLDVGLILLALALVLYVEVVLGILGIQSASRAAAATRAGARIGARAAAWERNLRTFLLTADEMVRIGHAAFMIRRKGRAKGSDGEAPEGRPLRSPPRAPWAQRWGMGDRFGIGMIVVGALLIGVAPWLTYHDVGSALAALIHELRPFPG
jgi:hypothetical protein